MARLDQDKQIKFEPKRMQYAKEELMRLGLTFKANDKVIEFFHKGEMVRLYPYSGWHTGKSIVDGRGINNLIKQLK